jgi:hypothetical protein
MIWGIEVSWESLHLDVPDIFGMEVVDFLGIVEFHQEVEEIVIAGVLSFVELVEARVFILIFSTWSGLL